MLSIAELTDNLRSDVTRQRVRNQPLKRRALSTLRWQVQEVQRNLFNPAGSRQCYDRTERCGQEQ